MSAVVGLLALEATQNFGSEIPKALLVLLESEQIERWVCPVHPRHRVDNVINSATTFITVVVGVRRYCNNGVGYRQAHQSQRKNNNCAYYRWMRPYVTSQPIHATHCIFSTPREPTYSPSSNVLRRTLLAPTFQHEENVREQKCDEQRRRNGSTELETSIGGGLVKKIANCCSERSGHNES